MRLDLPSQRSPLELVQALIENPHAADPELLAYITEGFRKYFFEGLPLHRALHLPASLVGVQRWQRDCALVHALALLEYDVGKLHKAVVAFSKHPWPIWQNYAECPDWAEGVERPLFYAFHITDGRLPQSREAYRLLAARAKTFPEKFGD